MNHLVIAGMLGTLGSARADTVGIVTDEPQLASTVGRWLSSHGRTVVDSALPADSIGTLRDCFVIEDPGCARSVVDRFATTSSVVYITLDRVDRDVTVATHWLVKGQPAATRRAKCTACTNTMLRDQVLANLSQLTSLPVATAGATTGAGAAAPHPTDLRQPRSSSRERRGLAIGVEVGEPTAATVAWFADRLAIVGGLGTGTFTGVGIALHAGAQFTVTELAPSVPLRVGGGARMYHHGYALASIDELPDTHYGVFASVAVALERGPLQLYAEVAPGIDVARTQSCTLASGPSTICPHAQSAPVFVHFVVGARWFLAH